MSIVAIIKNQGLRPVLTAATMLSLASVPAAAADIKALYNVSFMGIGIATGSLALRYDGSSYAAKIHISTSGLARIVSSEESYATAKGRMGRSLVPSSYELMSRGDKVTQVSMGISGGKVRSLSAIPELPERDDRVPVTKSAKRDVVDPLSAALVPVKGSFGPDICSRTLPIFDGWTRYDIRLSYKATKTIDVKGYKGDAVICSARWVPIAGHRTGTKSTDYMQSNRDLEAWFIPTLDQSMVVPYKISVKTMKGMLIVEAKQFDGAGGTDVAAAEK